MQAPVQDARLRSLNVPARLPEGTLVPVRSHPLAPVAPDSGADVDTPVRGRRALMLAVCCISLFIDRKSVV